MLEDLNQQHQLDFYFRFGSIVFKELESGSKLEVISEYLENKYVIGNNLSNVLKFYEIVSKGVKLSYKLNVKYYEVLFCLEDINLMNTCLKIAEKEMMTLDEFKILVNSKKNA